jgi:hypothetical protein
MKLDEVSSGDRDREYTSAVRIGHCFLCSDSLEPYDYCWLVLKLNIVVVCSACYISLKRGRTILSIEFKKA